MALWHHDTLVFALNEPTLSLETDMPRRFFSSKDTGADAGLSDLIEEDAAPTPADETLHTLSEEDEQPVEVAEDEGNPVVYRNQAGDEIEADGEVYAPVKTQEAPAPEFYQLLLYRSDEFRIIESRTRFEDEDALVEATEAAKDLGTPGAVTDQDGRPISRWDSRGESVS